MRIQRRNIKGWRMPENAVYVGRPSLWGNPFIAARGSEPAGVVTESGMIEIAWRDFDAKTTVKFYREWISQHTISDQYLEDMGYIHLIDRLKYLDNILPSINEIQARLRNKNLVCWCPFCRPCQADVLLNIANR